ncbi:23S rRNA (guanosine(2251)-2'-O)-methyltransferase RlmB [Saccharopolyspora rhizosphaerae]|uniref:23S rRNA (Guanosine(2251)-2'-O)-methyltransferase RlmB n=1 Tax=Saccharopolyspora rhizosphaerae TaxID=2492662 RepID=A0A3R8VGZ3_9PSEU|nr:23S rRNA (guanosine(2251)-2'-O)-methyltransferase RlmB [Saccharopolyspora rhizosphaerae]RRO17280.1 23S rRNA (guanosine(2251)-2'-O)-methyltransferase RlmB [Saccharopolyspora rhizosphaerae]
MAGNDKRRGGVRKTNKKGMVVGSGGQRRRGLKGKGPTPKAEDRVSHPAKKRAEQRAKAEQQRAKRQAAAENAPELVAGRNPVVECVRAGVPATGMYVAQGIDVDDRVGEAVREAENRGIPVVDVPRVELDRMTSGAVHQGLALQVPPFDYAHPDEVLRAAQDTGLPPLIVALDGVTDPRNLGAVIRSAAAFGAHGVVVPQRRSAGITAVTWRTSAGTAAKLPVAKAVNLTRTLKDYKEAGLMVVGLDADSDITSDELELATGPLVVVVGSEGRGLSRLVRDTCDQTVSIPMATDVESLNASVAAGVVLAEVARRRRIR